MIIKFSRHAQRRIKLYNINAADIEKAVHEWLKNASIINNRESLVVRELSVKYGYPLKVVFAFEGSTITIISAYPLKKEKSR